jgi:hypothetical protein
MRRFLQAATQQGPHHRVLRSHRHLAPLLKLDDDGRFPARRILLRQNKIDALA